jgi:hypothetical protein
VWLGLERLLHQFDSEANRVRTDFFSVGRHSRSTVVL